jgi:hypothetical protein
MSLPGNHDALPCQRAKNNELSVGALKDEARKVEVRSRLGMERHDVWGSEILQSTHYIFPICHRFILEAAMPIIQNRFLSDGGRQLI